eukprot:g4761.t1
MIVLQACGMLDIIATSRGTAIFKEARTIKDRLGFVNKVKTELHELFKFLREFRETTCIELVIVAFIDDLDRCLKGRNVKVLEAMQLMLSVPGAPVLAVLAIDSRIVVASIDEAFGKVFQGAYISGWEYLDKIVQIPFSLPAPPRAKVERLVASCLENGATALDKVANRVRRFVGQLPGRNSQVHNIEFGGKGRKKGQVINAETEKVTTIECHDPHKDKEEKWGGIVACGEKLYCAPNLASNVLVIDPKTETLRDIVVHERVVPRSRKLTFKNGQADTREELSEDRFLEAVKPFVQSAPGATTDEQLVREVARVLHVTTVTPNQERLGDKKMDDEEREIMCRGVDAALRSVCSRRAPFDDSNGNLDDGNQDAGADAVGDEGGDERKEEKADGEDQQTPLGHLYEAGDGATTQYSVSLFETQVIQDILGRVDPNPRRLKRLINTYQVVRAVANYTPLDQNKPDGVLLGDRNAKHAPRFREFCAKLIKWLVLCECYPYRMSLLVLKILDFQAMCKTNENVKGHKGAGKSKLFKFVKAENGDDVGMKHLDSDLPISAIFYEHVERVVDSNRMAEKFLRLDGDGEQFAALITHPVAVEGRDGDTNLQDITVADIIGPEQSQSNDSGPQWSLLTFSYNLNPAMRDQLSADINGLFTGIHLQRDKGGERALEPHSVRRKQSMVLRRRSLVPPATQLPPNRPASAPGAAQAPGMRKGHSQEPPVTRGPPSLPASGARPVHTDLVPVAITLEQGEDVRREMRQLVCGAPGAFFPPVLVTHATGRRLNKDADGTGPGMFYARWIARLLRARGVECFSSLCVGDGDARRLYLDKLGGARSRCKWLVVVQTPALYESRACLQEIYMALKKGMRILPVPFEGSDFTWFKLQPDDFEGREWLAETKHGFQVLTSVSPRAVQEKLDEIAAEQRLAPRIAGTDTLAQSGAGGAAAASPVHHLSDGVAHYNAALNTATKLDKRAAELQAAVHDLRAATDAADAGEMQDPENTDAARRYLAHALFFSAHSRMRARKPSGETRGQLREALLLAPGLNSKQQAKALRYLAHVTYASGKEKLLKRDFEEAAECFGAVTDPELRQYLLGVRTKHTDKLILEECKVLHGMCKLSISIQAFSTVQQWLEAHKLQILTPALQEVGVATDCGIEALVDGLEDEDVQALRDQLPKARRKMFDRRLGELKEFYEPGTELEPTYIDPGPELFLARTGAHNAANIQLAHGRPHADKAEEPRYREYSTGKKVKVWHRGGGDTVVYEVKKELGRGAMGIVYQVQEQEAKQVVGALKTSVDVAIIAEEARVMLRVNAKARHPHVLEVSYVCPGRDGELIVLAQLIEGKALDHLITSGRLYEGKDEEVRERLLRICVQLLSAVEHVHSCNVLHNDIKPENIIVNTDTWHACLVDFGIASIGEEQLHESTGHVNANFRGCTLPYCSHKQFEIYVMSKKKNGGNTTGMLTQCSDLWAAAVTCIDMYAGGSSWRGGV